MGRTGTGTLVPMPADIDQAGRIWRYVRRGSALLGLSMAGLVFGGVPIWAARRILYPFGKSAVPPVGEGALNLDLPVEAESVLFSARDGKSLGGWFVPGPHDSGAPWPCVLLVYGYGGWKEQMVAYARILHEGGFATFMFDMRGSGLAQGEPITLGYKERWDLMDAALYLRLRGDVDPERLGVFGVSMGGATALLAAAEDNSLKAIVADSAFADLNDMVRPGVQAFVGRYALPFAGLIVRYAETMIGVKSNEIKPELAARKLGNRPLLIIHGSEDILVDAASAHRLFAAASGPKEMWIVPQCEHAQGPTVAEADYKHRINSFFAEALG